MTPEGRVKKQVKQWLEDHGAYYYMPMQNGMGRSGIPDFICCLPWLNGRMVAIETKAPGKRSNTTRNQDRELRSINKAGGHAVVVDDVSQLAALEAVYAGKTETQKADTEPA
jgi:hypothetical protein